MEILLDLIIYFVVAAVVIWIVGKLGLGMEVSSYSAAIVAAIVIAIISAVLGFLGAMMFARYLEQSDQEDWKDDER